MIDIEFVPLTEKHLALLHQWFQIPHVKKWYEGMLPFEWFFAVFTLFIS